VAKNVGENVLKLYICTFLSDIDQIWLTRFVARPPTLPTKFEKKTLHEDLVSS
jgi:hypothetical protein